MSFEDHLPDAFSERAPHTGNLEAVREPRMHKIVFGQRVDLRLILKPSEGVRKYNPIIILFEGTAVRLGGSRLLAKAVGGEKGFPVHVLDEISNEFLSDRQASSNKFHDFKLNPIYTCYF